MYLLCSEFHHLCQNSPWCNIRERFFLFFYFFVRVCLGAVLSHLAPTVSPQLDNIHPLKRPKDPAVC